MSRQSTKKYVRKTPVNQEQIEDKEISEILQVLLARKPFYEKLLLNLMRMGLPVAKPTVQNQNLQANLRRNPKNINLIQRFLSIHLEGQPKIYHRVKLAQNCQHVISCICNLDIEEMLGLVHESVKISDLQELERVEKKKKQGDKKLTEFSLPYFLDLIDAQNVIVQEQYSTFNSTEIDGVYEMKDINLLKDYGDIQYFEKTRVLRQKVYEVISAIVKILDSFQTNNIDLIQDTFVDYIQLKRNLEFPFTQKVIEEQISEDEERYSTKSDISANSSHSIKIEVSQISRAQSVHKRQPQIDTKSTQQMQQKGYLSEINQKSLKKQIIKKKTKKGPEQTKIWNSLTQNKFEEIFYQSQDVSLQNLTQRIPDFQFKLSSKRKKLQSQGKRCVVYEVFDSYRYYEAKILEIKTINPRNPYNKYSFIQYDLDSEEEMDEEVAEDVQSEIRSLDGTPTSSIQEFIEMDYKICNQFYNGNATQQIQNQNNIEQFIPYQAIMISDNRPTHKSTQKKKVPTTKINLQNLPLATQSTQLEQEKPPILDTNQILVIAQSDFQIVPNDCDVRQEQ